MITAIAVLCLAVSAVAQAFALWLSVRAFNARIAELDVLTARLARLEARATALELEALEVPRGLRR